jgi:ABC-type molybdenum transport system ATPase subunit/photorepair protein PhrA
MSAAVRLEDVRVVIGGRLLLDVPHLTIEPGERVAIVGPTARARARCSG